MLVSKLELQKELEIYLKSKPSWTDAGNLLRDLYLSL
jgi:hypothetical protein